MAPPLSTEFLAGVIEGFYGAPWSPAERLELLDWMSRWGLNCYLYAPKDDLKHRALWRERYTPSEATALGELIQACQRHGVRFVYGLSPGLDIRYSRESELHHLQDRLDQMLSLGCQDFALLFDDLPDTLGAEDQQRWGSFAAAQCHVTNNLLRWTRQRAPAGRFLFCPTPYCGRMAQRGHGGKGYLDTIGSQLCPDIDVFWTGPEIISRDIPVTHVQDVHRLLRRRPLIWDNLHANDYDGRRFYCGPYAGRPPELREAVAGLLANPNNEFPLNYVPLRTLAQFVHGEGSWEARTAYLSALEEWLPRFATVGQPLTLEDLTLLGDCHYLPHEEGPEAEAIYDAARRMLGREDPDRAERMAFFQRRAAQLRDVCARLSELHDRPLFHAMSRRTWELREELDLLLGWVRLQGEPREERTPCRSDFHLPGTYRGGLVARLQRLLTLQPDGTFLPSPPAAANPPPPPEPRSP